MVSWMLTVSSTASVAALDTTEEALLHLPAIPCVKSFSLQLAGPSLPTLAWLFHGLFRQVCLPVVLDIH